MPVDPLPSRPVIQTTLQAIFFGAGDAKMKMIIVGKGVGGLMKDPGGARDKVGVRALGAGKVQQNTFERIADKEPLNIDRRMLQQGAHELPIALGIKDQVGASDGHSRGVKSE